MFVTIGERRVHAVAFGPRSLPLVAMAGSIGSWEIWQQPMELLSSRFRVVAIDHDGVGETKVASVDAICFEQLVETLLSTLDALEIDDCVLAGDSNNVAVALEAALRQPSRFRGLVLVSGAAWGFDRPDVRRFIGALRADFPNTVDAFAKRCLPEDREGHLQRWLSDIIHRTGCDACCRLIEAYFGIDLRERLHEIEVPTLVIHGALDRLHPDAGADAQRLTAALPNARLEVLDQAGHVPTLSQPEQVAEWIEALMRQVERQV
jgi:3-oxoadipate enol-lactonase